MQHVALSPPDRPTTAQSLSRARASNYPANPSRPDHSSRPPLRHESGREISLINPSFSKEPPLFCRSCVAAIWNRDWTLNGRGKKKK